MTGQAGPTARPIPRLPEEAPLSDDALRRGARYLVGCLLAAVALDLFIVGFLLNDSGIVRHRLFAFAQINVTLLGATCLLVYITQIRARVPWRPATEVATVATALSTIVWMQLTGLVSSYFIVAGMLEIVLFRGYYSRRTGLVSAGALLLFHLVAFALEEVGVLQRLGLFAGPVPAYLGTSYRFMALSSIAMTYVMTYVGTDLFVARLRQREADLRAVRRDLERVVHGARHGRLSGTQLDDLRLGELLGRGGMGEVYFAEDDKGQAHAVKVLHPHLLEEGTVVDRFLREAEAASRVSGHHTALLRRIGRTADDIPYIVMEYLRGEDLGAYLRRSPALSVELVGVLATKIAAALDAVHRAGIVHRDLKPANVFLDADEQDRNTSATSVKILDFGICKLREASATLTSESMVIGTPGYMAPEQARGDVARISIHTDVFALGAILYRAATGQLPFPSTDPMVAMSQVCEMEPHGPSDLRADLPRTVDAVFRIALAKRPEDRFASAGELAAALVVALAGETNPEIEARATRLPWGDALPTRV